MKVFSDFPSDYELIDAGNEFKLERWGNIITIRPEHQAYFKPEFSAEYWKELAHWEFIPNSAGSLTGKWNRLKGNAPEEWKMEMDDCIFQLQLTSNKHIGLFPEQQINWSFISSYLTPDKRFLNAFAYTGAASCFGAKTGAEIIHCDSVKPMIDWAKKNAEQSQVSTIKWVLEDAFKFIGRERKRGNKYDLIQLDPPAWGIGTNKEKWKLERDLPALLEETLDLLNPGGTLILNTYSPKMNLAKLNTLCKSLENCSAENKELWLKTTTGKNLYYGILTRIVRG